MKPDLRIALAALLLCAHLTWATAAGAQESLSVHASFTPDRLSAVTNLSLTAGFISGTGGLPSPVRKLSLYAPAGIVIDSRGAGTCTAQTLQRQGPSGCPVDSRAGFGGGLGAISLPKEAVRAPYTLDLFFAPREDGRLRLLVYASSRAPIGVELVLIARQIPARRPFGLGFSVEVPPITTFPGAPDASIESAFVTIGAPNVAYYEPVRGRKRLVHIRGIIVPKRCPTGGFPTEGIVDLADGTVLTVNSTIPCPGS